MKSSASRRRPNDPAIQTHDLADPPRLIGRLGNRGITLTRTWTPQEIALLGAMSDAQVARQIGGISFATVQKKRRELGIPPAAPAHRSWPPEHIAMLGALPDSEVARLTGRSTRAVNQKRNKLGIPSAQRKGIQRVQRHSAPKQQETPPPMKKTGIS